MIIVNFGHPLSEEARGQLAEHGELCILDIKMHLDMAEPLAPQVARVVEGVALSSEEWQTKAIVVCLPGMSTAAAVVLAEVNGRMGSFPRIVALTRGEDGIFRVGEIIDLASVRSAARASR